MNPKQEVAKFTVTKIPENIVLGVGSGSTVEAFINELGKAKLRLKGIVAASSSSENLLKTYGYECLDLNQVNEMPYYVDGADEVTPGGLMIKGGGAALTREKIISGVANKFICMVEEKKVKDVLGDFSLPIEVIPMARSYVARKIVIMGGHPTYRTGVNTDNGNVILDVIGFDFTNPFILEEKLNQITGVVCNGIFANRRADEVLIADSAGAISTIKT